MKATMLTVFPVNNIPVLIGVHNDTTLTNDLQYASISNRTTVKIQLVKSGHRLTR